MRERFWMDVVEWTSILLAWAFVVLAFSLTALVPFALVFRVLQLATCGVVAI